MIVGGDDADQVIGLRRLRVDRVIRQLILERTNGDRLILEGRSATDDLEIRQRLDIVHIHRAKAKPWRLSRIGQLPCSSTTTLAIIPTTDLYPST